MPTLKSIAVTTPPAKMAYVAGETFDPSGMTVTATYNDTSTAVVSDYSVSPSGSLTTADSVITVSYTEGDATVTATVNITVKTRRITYTGQSKPIIRLAEAVNVLFAAPRLFVDGDGYICVDYGGEESGNGE